MKSKLTLLQARIACAVALGIGWSLSPAASGSAGIPAGAPKDWADRAPVRTSIPWSQLGAKAGVDYQGHGLAVTAMPGPAVMESALSNRKRTMRSSGGRAAGLNTRKSSCRSGRAAGGREAGCMIAVIPFTP